MDKAKAERKSAAAAYESAMARLEEANEQLAFSSAAKVIGGDGICSAASWR